MWSLSFNIIASKIPFHEHTILLQAKWAPHVCSFSLVLSCTPYNTIFLFVSSLLGNYLQVTGAVYILEGEKNWPLQLHYVILCSNFLEHYLN
jgi:hypothetical protein